MLIIAGSIIECQHLWLSGLFQVQATPMTMFAACVQLGSASAASSLN